MKTEIIAVGTELLLGQTVNTNATFLSKELAEIGYEVYYQSVVGDNRKRLMEVLEIAMSRSELIVLCGGLGPTEDDITKQVVADFIGTELETDDYALEKLTQRIKAAGRELTENNLKQAQFIKSGRVIKNDRGLAIGSLVKYDNHYLLLLPGPPSELKPMMKDHVIPLLKDLLPEENLLTSKVMRFYGLGESGIADRLNDLIMSQTNPTIALYAKENEVTIRLTAKGKSEHDNHIILEKVETKILNELNEYFYGYGEDNSLVNELFKLIPKNTTIRLDDYFTEGRLGLSWQKNISQKKLDVKLFNESSNDEFVLFDEENDMINKPYKFEDLEKSCAAYLSIPTDDIQILVFGDQNSSNKEMFYEAEMWIAIRVNGQVHLKKSIFANNFDSLKNQSSLEVSAFLLSILKKQNKKGTNIRKKLDF